MNGQSAPVSFADTSASICRCWLLRRADDVTYGFTDHDEDVAFDGIVYRADSGLTARALQQSTGLAVDNSEVVGVLSDASVTEQDIDAGRFDGAVVEMWLVDWENPSERAIQFRGSLGDIERSAGSFRAELRGLAEVLNRRQGLIYQQPCSAVLGDGKCKVDMASPGMSADTLVSTVVDRRTVVLQGLAAFDAKWFERGRLTFTSGAAQGLAGVVKSDRTDQGGRLVELWQEIRAGFIAGDAVRLEAGCDKRADTCRGKFDNFLNFRGFPHIPGDDWQMAYPTRRNVNDGGSLNR